jgi:hypothetical protein
MKDLSSNGGMGITKHAKSGKPPKSPKARHRLKREAESVSIKAKSYPMTDSINKLFGGK